MAMCMCEALMPTVGHTAFETQCQYCTLTFSEERVVGMGHRPPSLGRALTDWLQGDCCSQFAAVSVLLPLRPLRFGHVNLRQQKRHTAATASSPLRKEEAAASRNAL